MAAPIPKNMLFSLNGIDFAAAYGDLKEAHNLYGAGASTMAYWSNTEGGGRFTLKVSQAFISQLRQWMVSQKFKSGIAYNTKYGKWKEKQGSSKEWVLFGNVFHNISVIWRGKHGRTIGIKRNIKVPRVSIGGKSHGMISIAKYAAINEWGFENHPARPLFRPAMEAFVAQKFPPMVKMMKKALKESLKKESKKIVPAEAVGSANNTISQASLAGMSKVAGSNPDKDFKAHIIEVGSSLPMTKTILRKGSKATGSTIKNSEKIMDAWMAANNYTDADLEDIT